MNLISFDRMEPEKGYMLLRDFRKEDNNKILIILSDMMKKLKLVKDQFNYNLQVKNADSIYAGGFINKLEKIHISLMLGKFQNEIVLDKPKLVYDNCYQMNGSLYVPICFMERAPIDRIAPKAPNLHKNKLLLNLLNEPILFDFKAKTVKFSRRKSIEISTFFKAIFTDSAYKDFLQEVYNEFGKPQINNRELSIKECKTKSLQAMGFTGLDRFNTLEIDEFFDNFVILDYEKELLKDYYGYSDFKDLLRLSYEYYKRDIDINLADIRNRRLVLMEYLMHPVFKFYNRILWNFIDSDYKEYMIPKLPANTLINEGFRTQMHGEQLFNITLPYITPLVHKISQSIVVISKKVPKKWTSNHPSAMGVLCPISVSAQDMGSNLVATMETEVTFHGRIKSFIMPDRSDLMIKLDPIELSGEKFKESIEILGKFVVDSTTGEVVAELSQSEIEARRETSILTGSDLDRELKMDTFVSDEFNMDDEESDLSGGETDIISMPEFVEDALEIAKEAEEEDNFDILENLDINEDI